MGKYRAEKDALIIVEFDTMDEFDDKLRVTDIEDTLNDVTISLLDNCTFYLDGEEIDEDEIP